MAPPRADALPSPSRWLQLRAITRKNLILLRRQRSDFFREMLYPFLLIFVLVSLRGLFKNEVQPTVLHFDPMPISTHGLGGQLNSVLFAPCAPDKSGPVGGVAAAFALQFNITTTCFACDVAGPACGGAKSLEQTYLDAAAADTKFGDARMAGVVFSNPAALSKGSTDTIKYALRLGANALPGVGSDNVTQTNLTGPDGTASTYVSLFTPLQRAVDAAVAAVASNAAPGPLFPLYVQQFPHGSYAFSPGASFMNILMPVYILIIFTVQVRVLLTRILEEKEKKIKEGMLMMGLSDEVFWGSWFVLSMGKNLFITVGLSVLGKIGQLFTYSDVSVLISFYMVFAMSCVSLVFMMSTFFSSARTGGAVGALGFMAMYLPMLAIGGGNSGGGVKLGLSLISPIAFSVGNSILGDLNNKNTGVTWGTLYSTANQDQGMSMGAVMGMLLLDTCLYLFLAWYFDKVLPSEWGTRLKPWFLCSRKYWAARSTTVPVDTTPLLGGEGRGGADESVDAELVSEEVSRRGGVSIGRLRKVFSTPDGDKVAVNDLSLDMYQDQITCLLGHNGAGKTTTVSMLVGLFAPTGGDATVFGRSVVNDIAGVRQLCGVCPQHDILFDRLTVREHLELFAGIKGIEAALIPKLAREMANEVRLMDKFDTESTALSGGQKRRLSLAIALVGDPKVLFLDEPTSGLDPANRRQIWELLERKKEGRVIVLSTHFMEEADLLGDRIAIMASGRLRVVGSSFYLKMRFGVGYHLDVSLLPGRGAGGVTKTILKHVPLAERETAETQGAGPAAFVAGGGDGGGGESKAGDGSDAAGQEVSFVLPLASVSAFGALFGDLEEHGPEHGVDSFGISITSLEEVFMRLAADVEAEEALTVASGGVLASGGGESGTSHGAAGGAGGSRSASGRKVLADLGKHASGRHYSGGSGPAAVVKARRSGSASETTVSMSAGGSGGGGRDDDVARLGASPGTLRLRDQTGFPAFKRQFAAQVWRRAKMARRDKKGLWLQIVLPIVFVAISSVFRSIGSAVQAPPPPPLPMTPSQWSDVGHPMTLPYVRGGPVPSDAAVRAVVGRMPTPKQAPGMPTLVPMFAGDAPAPSMTAVEQHVLDAEYQAGVLAFNESLALLMFNTSLTSGIPILTSLLDGAVLGDLAAARGPAPLEATFHSFPHAKASAAQLLPQYIMAGLMGFYIVLGYTTIPALQAINIVTEREKKSKQIQVVMGAGPASYWFSNWFWDALLYIAAPWIATIVLVYVLGPPEFVHNIGALAVTSLMWGIATPGPVYAFSFAFDNARTAQTYTMLTWYMLTIVLFFAAFMLNLPMADQPAWRVTLGDAVRYGAMLFPNTGLAMAFLDTGLKTSCALEKLRGLPCTPPSAWSWDVCGEKIVFLALTSAFWAVVVLRMEVTVGRPKAPKGGAAPYGMTAGAEEVEDDDVRAERARIDGGRVADNIVARHLRKEFKGRGGKVAVKDLCLGLREGECFGLLGPNGAGKTTTLSMLTGELGPSFGSASMAGHDVHEAREAVYDMMGYCPQSDAIFELLTTEENLGFYARLKGIVDDEIPGLIENALTQMDLKKYRNVHSGTLSGGNKRKLSLAIAFIGAARVVFLDEPSTGMDPMARRRMWQVVDASRQGRTVILTTHLLEEADALCQRIGILVDGRLACLGTAQHLKSLYGAGYQLELQSGRPELAEEIAAFVRGLSSGAKLLEGHVGRFKFELATGVRVSAVFRALEEAKERLAIEYYSVSQTTLEQVFLNFAKRQAEAEEAHNRNGGAGGVSAGALASLEANPMGAGAAAGAP